MIGGRHGALRRPLSAATLTLVVLGIGWLALSPAPPPSVDTGWDKLNHLLAFAVLSFIAQGAAERPATPRLAVVVGLILYGLGIEAAQAWVPGRSSEWQDLLANAAGIGSGCALAWAVWRQKPEAVVD
jgi:VanZ family protein